MTKEVRPINWATTFLDGEARILCFITPLAPLTLGGGFYRCFVSALKKKILCFANPLFMKAIFFYPP
jgi:hypothetical protein